MIKVGAWSILTAIFIPLFGFAGMKIVQHGEKISRLETSKEYETRLLKETREDVKYIRNILDTRKK